MSSGNSSGNSSGKTTGMSSGRSSRSSSASGRCALGDELAVVIPRWWLYPVMASRWWHGMMVLTWCYPCEIVHVDLCLCFSAYILNLSYIESSRNSSGMSSGQSSRKNTEQQNGKSSRSSSASGRCAFGDELAVVNPGNDGTWLWHPGETRVMLSVWYSSCWFIFMSFPASILYISYIERFRNSSGMSLGQSSRKSNG